MLQEGKEHRRLLIFGEGLVLAVFHHAYNFCSLAAPELEVPSDRFIDGSEDLARKLAIDDCHQWSLVLVVHGEAPAGQKRGAGGAEVVRRNVEVLGVAHRICGPKVGGCVGEYVGIVTAETEWKT